MPYATTDKLEASLEVQQWNQIMALLQEQPYRLSAPIIAALAEQFAAAQQQDAASVIPMRGEPHA